MLLIMLREQVGA